MKMQETGVQTAAGPYRMKRAMVAAVGMALFVAVAVVAYVLCTFQMKVSTQEILNAQREMEQVRVEKTLEAVRAWRNSLVEQAHFISLSETFRLFAVDARNLGADARKRLNDSEAVRSSDEALASMAEQMAYMRDILHDFSRRRNFTSARVVGPDGVSLIAEAGAAPLSEALVALVRRAGESKGTAFGPIRAQGDELRMDLVDPLYEVLGSGEPKVVAFLLLSVPLDEALRDFLALDQNREFMPRIFQKSSAGPEVIFLRDGKLTLAKAAFAADSAAGLPFKRRLGLAGDGDVYSLGSRIADLDWCVTLEIHAKIVDGLLENQAEQIYGLGILGSLGAGLFLAFLWAGMVSRSHRATAQRFQQLYTLIRRQKLMLDSINASLQAGLLMVDNQGRAQVCNPAFCRLAGKSEETMVGAVLTDMLPEKAALALQNGMSKVGGSGVMDSIEISLDNADGAHLFRVTLFPFEDVNDDDGGKPSHGGCVGIFQDITEFRRRAEEARERQANSISALVRAIESVDVNLIGHSRKMERVVDLLTGRMQMEDKDRETLRLAARLSQVGKIFVPRHLLTKQGKLTPEEQQEVMRAPEYAYGALRDLQFGLPVPEAVFQMGERLDGTGQPRKLKGDEIVYNARILAVVNAFCAMVSDRSYRAGMSPEEAVALLAKDAGFEPNVVKALANVPLEDVRRAVGKDAASESAAGAEGSGVDLVAGIAQDDAKNDVPAGGQAAAQADPKS